MDSHNSRNPSRRLRGLLARAENGRAHRRKRNMIFLNINRVHSQRKKSN